MENLAGVETADDTILEELYLAGIEPIKIDKGHTEVPYTYIATIGKWTLTRSWRYWVARVEEGANGMPIEGLPLLDAVALYNKKHPLNDSKLGEIIRAGGDAGSLSPTSYVAQPMYNDELTEKLVELGYEKSYHPIIVGPYIDISSGDVAKLCNEGKLEVERFVDCYHIDDQIGLNELVKVLKKHSDKYIQR